MYFDNYLRQISCVIWRDYKSEYFNVSNGVKQGGVISPIFFSLYIDPLLLALKKSQIGCHMNNVYMGALSYADDITIICPGIRGLNKMLKICNECAQSNKIIFNSKKTICIKFGDKHITPEKAFLTSECLSWTDNIRHLVNFIDCSNIDMVDCGIKKECSLDMLTNYVVIMTHSSLIF